MLERKLDMILTSVHENKVGGWKLQSTLPLSQKESSFVDQVQKTCDLCERGQSNRDGFTGGCRGCDSPPPIFVFFGKLCFCPVKSHFWWSVVAK